MGILLWISATLLACMILLLLFRILLLLPIGRALLAGDAAAGCPGWEILLLVLLLALAVWAGVLLLRRKK